MEQLERYRIVSRRPTLRLEASQGRAATAYAAASVALWLAVWFLFGGRWGLFALSGLAVAAGIVAMFRREHWEFGAAGVRLDRRPWGRQIARPREVFERVALRFDGSGDGGPALPWRVTLEDRHGSRLFELHFRGEVGARVLGRLLVEALELEMTDGVEIDPKIAASVRRALERI